MPPPIPQRLQLAAQLERDTPLLQVVQRLDTRCLLDQAVPKTPWHDGTTHQVLPQEPAQTEQSTELHSRCRIIC